MEATCKLSDIFSAPRRRERLFGSGEWTPNSEEGADDRGGEGKAFGEGGLDGALNGGLDGGVGGAGVASAGGVSIGLVGVDGEYRGQTLRLCLRGFGGSACVGRSSACELTLAADDQISRKHVTLSLVDGRVYAKDAGSTCARDLTQSE
eukprot:2700921-Pleurochrysis_carterae.AAC.1